jgi:RND superfamily putative drug exporter
VAVLIAITLVLALLAFAGMRVAKGKSFSTSANTHKPTMGSRWSGLVVRHRWLAVAGLS